MNETMIKIDNVSKEYSLGNIYGTTIKEAIKRRFSKKEDCIEEIKSVKKDEKFKALDEVSFEVKKGEVLGLIGRNGAGKSTLLKLISRITAPTKGKIYLNGKVASMLEIGTGFHGELTGRENIYLNGTILGMTKKEIDAKIEDIIDFAEIRKFIDTPVKRYSSGMYVKLAFSIVAHLDSDILLMDEVLAVGDVAFQSKCLAKMHEVAKSGRTVIFVSHNMKTVREICDRCVVLENGKVVFDGDTEKAISRYLGLSSEMKSEYDFSEIDRRDNFSHELKITGLKFLNETPRFLCGSIIEFNLSVLSQAKFEGVDFKFEIFSEDGVKIGTAFLPSSLSGEVGKKLKISTSLSLGNLASGKYSIGIYAYKTIKGINFGVDHVAAAVQFELIDEENKWNTKFLGNVKFEQMSCDVSGQI